MTTDATAMTTETRLPPFDTAAEEAVIAALMIDNASYWQVHPLLKPRDFFRDEHGWAYRAAEQLFNRQEPVTLESLMHELARTYIGSSSQLELAGGERWLTALLSRHFAAVGVEAHARIVARDSRYRSMISAAQRIVQLGYEGGPDDEAALATASGLIDSIRTGSAMMGALTNEQVVQAIIANGELESERQRGITSGWLAIDKLTHGYAPGEVVAIAAATSVGKTAWALMGAMHQAEQDIFVGYIPVEGDRNVLTHRIAASYAGYTIAQHRQQMPWTRSHDLMPYEEGLAMASTLPLFWPDHYMNRIGDICSWISVQAHQSGVKCFYIDHIDAVEGGRERDSRAGEIADILRQVENTARREKVTIVFLSQVNRAAADRQRLPTIRDMRESGSKEELSQIIITLHRDRTQVQGFTRMQCAVGKNTEGPTGLVTRWDDDRDDNSAFTFNTRTATVEEPGAPAHY